MDLGSNGPSWTGRVVSLHVCSEAAEPMTEVPAVTAVAARGIEGDRYFLGTGFYSDKPGPDRELTLLELETIDALRHEHRIELEPREARRNVVIEVSPSTISYTVSSRSAEKSDRARDPTVRARVLTSWR